MNCPTLGWEKCVEQVNALRLQSGVRAKFLRENVRRVYRLGSPAPRFRGFRLQTDAKPGN